MAIKRYKMGPGTLQIDGTDYSAQVRACRVAFSTNTTTTEETPVLSGEKIDGSASSSSTAALTANLVQDLDAAGMVEWSWLNSGQEVPVTFIPSTAKGREVTGTIVVAPIDLGGDVEDDRPSSDVSWPFVGMPVLGAVGP